MKKFILAYLIFFIISISAWSDIVADRYNNARQLYINGNFEKAKTILWNILEYNPNDEKSLDLLSQILFEEADAGDIGEYQSGIKITNDENDLNKWLEDLKDENFKTNPESVSDIPIEETKETVTDKKVFRKKKYTKISNDIDEVKEISVINRKKSCDVIIVTDMKMPKFSAEKIFKKKSMLAVDIFNTANNLPRGKFVIDNKYITVIRHSQFSISPVKTVRVVIDLKNKKTRYFITQQDNYLIIKLNN